ncbi:MAG: GNAT family N-acetyltransferase [Thalassobaculales bacterium]
MTAERAAEIAADLAGWIAEATRQDGTVRLADGREVPRVPFSLLWAVDGEDAFVGHVSIRHQLSEELRRTGGHVGWSIRPSRWGRGCGTAMARLAMAECRRLGIDPVLITCNAANTASRRIIERLGGSLEAEIPHPYEAGTLRRYWVPAG